MPVLKPPGKHNPLCLGYFMTHGTLYLIPTPLGERELTYLLPPDVIARAASLEIFVVEHAKTARAFLKQLPLRVPLQSLTLSVLNEHTQANEIQALLAPLLAGKDVGLISEAGCPAVADPGAVLVKLAHQQQIRVVPLVGPSSLLLGLMASGLCGQRFRFHGYLPVDKTERENALLALEKESAARDETQIFIETPYRNQLLFTAILESCLARTELCLAIDVSLASENIVTRTISEWKKQTPVLDKRPAVFLLHANATR